MFNVPLDTKSVTLEMPSPADLLTSGEKTKNQQETSTKTAITTPV